MKHEKTQPLKLEGLPHVGHSLPDLLLTRLNISGNVSGVDCTILYALDRQWANGVISLS